MKPLSFHRNLPAISDKKSFLRINKQAPIVHNPSFLEFQRISNIIINTQSLPVEIEAELKDAKLPTIIIGLQSISVKGESERFSLPLYILQQKWVKITFGEEFKRAEIRSKYNENKITKKSIYTDEHSWRSDNLEEKKPLKEFDMQRMLSAIRVKNQGFTGGASRSKRQISSFMKAKFSERANSYSYKSGLRAKRDTENKTLLAHYEDPTDLDISQYKKAESTTLNLNDGLKTKDKSIRMTNTSNSRRSDSNDIRFSKKVRRPNDNTQYKPSFVEQPSQFIPVHIGKQKPRFYQQIPLTFEEIELKRKKFDSQFIIKRELAEQVAFKPSQSEVTEDIVRGDASKIHLEDTLQRGFMQNQRINLATQQSGTLCQSVFQ